MSGGLRRVHRPTCYGEESPQPWSPAPPLPRMQKGLQSLAGGREGRICTMVSPEGGPHPQHCWFLGASGWRLCPRHVAWPEDRAFT